ncbi:MAG: GIY-YIG nuclease family protein [Pseudomonadota bacterium]
MKATAKTIQIFLPDGDPQGIRVAEITTRIVQVIEVPRSLLQDFLAMPESKQVAVYFLTGEAEDGTDPRVYIGQTGDLEQRLTSHNKLKEFWQRALVMISRTNSLTQTHTLFLEWYSLQACKKAGRYTDENGNNGSKPHTPPPLQADCMEIYETGQTLLATLGYPLFEPVVKPTTPAQEDDIFFCKSSDADGRGQYTQEGFVVLKGSIGRKENVPSLLGTAGERLRSRLLDTGVMRAEGDTVVFEKDHLFRSPSMAALSLMGRTCNGWISWKAADGRTLDAIKRQ